MNHNHIKYIKMEKKSFLWPLLLVGTMACATQNKKSADDGIHTMELTKVRIEDSFWKPKFDQWRTTTAKDVLDKFEGKNVKEKEPGKLYSVIENFDQVAQGQRDIHQHAGLPWFDGLIYETIRGLADLMAQSPDPELKKRIDSYIESIAAAQATEETGFINTYTQLVENDHRWGENGGLLRWMHDVYNAGMLVEAGIHYYKATGETRLLTVATRLANYMSDYMGPEPKRNIVPAHSGPEEPLVKLYRLYTEQPELKEKIDVPVQPEAYLKLAEFWIEGRGRHCGLPLWGTWGNTEAEKWIKDNKYADPKYGSHSRPSFGPYAQDSVPLHEQQTIEGHAVRATLYLTGTVAAALVDPKSEYIESAKRLWDNMAGKRMFVTGGVGAISEDEKFGPDYYLPPSAYLETCAAVGAGFFSQQMNELTGDAKYMDEFERALYNNVLTGISLSGDEYTYQNPLNSDTHSRWEWHDCPCCPPMFLKFISAMPGYIYSRQKDQIFVNLFVGSKATIKLADQEVRLTQETGYPWEGNVKLTVNPAKKQPFTVNLRIPGWARSIENPYGLYSSNITEDVTLKINGTQEPIRLVNGYATISRTWSAGDRIELSLPMQPRLIKAHPSVTDLNGLVALAAGPLIYCLEGCDNTDLADLKIDSRAPLHISYRQELLQGTNVIEGKALTKTNQGVTFRAIPYYLLGNRIKGSAYKVWIEGN